MKKIRTQILFYFTAIVILAIFLINTFVFNVFYKSIEKESMKKLQYLTINKAVEYGKTFAITENNVNILSDMITKSFDMKKFNKISPLTNSFDKDHIPYISNYVEKVLNPLTFDFVKNTPNVFGGYFNFDPEFLKNKMMIGSWVTKTKEDEDYKSIQNGLSADLYPTNKPSSQWFFKPKQEGKPFWSKVYVDDDIKVKMISRTMPIYSRNEFIGVAGMDISLEQIQKQVSALKLYKTGSASLLDKDFHFIFISKNSSSAGLEKIENGNYVDLIKKIKQNPDGIMTVKENKKDYFVSYAHLPNGFVLLVNVPKSEVLQDLNDIKLIWFVMILIFLATSIICSNIIAKKIANPIETLTDASEKLSRGSLNVKIPENNKIKEIHELAVALNEFSNIYQIHLDNENLLNLIMENIPDSIILTEDCNIKSCNSATKEIFGYDESEIIGNSLHKLLPIHNFICENNFLNESCYLKDSTDNKKEIIGVKEDGSSVFVEIISKELIIKHQKSHMIVIKDISKQKEVDELKNNFISMISHELRTPLTSIRGALGLVSTEALGILPEKAKNLMNIANNNVVRLVNLINDILDLEKIKAGKMDYKCQEYDVMDLIRETIDYNEAYAKQYSVRYKISEYLESALVNVDKDKFIQVLTNLLSNAAKFSTENENVEVNINRNAGSILISITNKGHGIPEESYSKIFGCFSQVDSSDNRAKGGSGLGLHISKSIIEKMGGTIGFDSIVDKKTTFYIELPEIHITQNKKTVLVCEDSATTAFGIKTILEKNGYSIDIAINAREAYKLLDEKIYDLMTLDITLPDENGLVLLENIKNKEITKDLPVIIISAAKNDENNIEVQKQISSWLEKSFDSEELINVVNKVIQQKTYEKAKLNILHVEDDEDIIEIVSTTLDGIANMKGTRSILEAENILNDSIFDIIILDYNLPDGTCDKLFDKIKTGANKYANIIVFSAYEVSTTFAQQVDTVLLKSKISNEEFLNCILTSYK